MSPDTTIPKKIHSGERVGCSRSSCGQNKTRGSNAGLILSGDGKTLVKVEWPEYNTGQHSSNTQRHEVAGVSDPYKDSAHGGGYQGEKGWVRDTDVATIRAASL